MERAIRWLLVEDHQIHQSLPREIDQAGGQLAAHQVAPPPLLAAAQLAYGARLRLQHVMPNMCLTAEEAWATLDQLRNEPPHVVVIDVALPDGGINDRNNGFRLAVEMRQERPNLAVLLCSGEGPQRSDGDWVYHANSAGIAGYLLKEEPPIHWARAIARAALGHRRIFVPHHVEQDWNSCLKSPPLFSPTVERTIVAFALGHWADDTELGKVLGLSKGTVGDYLDSARKEIGTHLKSRSQLALWLHRHWEPLQAYLQAGAGPGYDLESEERAKKVAIELLGLAKQSPRL